MTVLLVAVVVVALGVATGSRINQARLGGRHVRAHRQALGTLATITTDQPDGVEADVSQAHLHVRLVDEATPGAGEPSVLDLRDPPWGSGDAGTAVASPVAGSPPPARAGPPERADAGPHPDPTALLGTTLWGLEARMAEMDEADIEVSALSTGAVAALTRFGPAELRSRRQRRRAARRG